MYVRSIDRLWPEVRSFQHHYMEVPTFTLHTLSGAIKAAITSVIVLALFYVLAALKQVHVLVCTLSIKNVCLHSSH